MVKLTIKDEVKIHISGLTIDIRRKLVNAFKYEIPGAKYQPKYKLGRWDGCVSLFSMSGDGYVNQLEKILDILEENKIQIEDVEDLRENLNLKISDISTDFWGDRKWPTGHRIEGEVIRLRDDQVDAANIFFKNTQSMQSLCTSFGKTILCATLVKSVEHIGRTLTIVPNTNLVEQTEEDYINCGLDVGVYYGSRKQFDKTHTICTWQSLNVLIKKNKKISETEILSISDLLHNVKTVICDEAHLVNGAKLQTLLVDYCHNAAIRWGITGTIPKAEHESEKIFTILGKLVNEVKASDLQEVGFLAKCHIHIKQYLEFYEFKNYQEELKYLISDRSRMKHIADAIDVIAKSGNTLILVDRIECGDLLMEFLPDSIFISGTDKTIDRKKQYDEFKFVNNKKLIATYGIASTGISINEIYNLVYIEVGKSFVRVIQTIGRGLRLGKDKDFVNVYDFTSNCKFSSRHLSERKKYYREANYDFSITKIDWNNKK